jgi:SAM-dependent methyltransferase
MSDVSIWNQSNLGSKAQHRFFPTDMMLRSIFSDRYFNIKNNQAGGCLLDIGTMYANNLVPFADRDWELYGTEVTDESVKIAKTCCDLNKLSAEVKLGFNSDLPFESNKFDVLLSLATIHYEESLDDVDSALKEMSRVLKNDGCALIQTVAPQHTLFKNSSKIGKNIYQLHMMDDLRHGQKFTFFEHSDELVEIAKKYFSSVEVARCTETYPNLCIDMWLIKLKKA